MTYDWPQIRALYERGVSPVEIARQVPESPSRQAIAKRALREGWTVAQSDTDCIAAPRDIVVAKIREGATKTMAAAAAGISRDTLHAWLHDPTFSARVESAKAAFLTEHIGNIHEAGKRDWKASAYLLERAPETRDQFSQKQDAGGITIVLALDRTKGVLLEHDSPAISGELAIPADAATRESMPSPE